MGESRASVHKCRTKLNPVMNVLSIKPQILTHYVQRQCCIIIMVFLSSFILEKANGKQPREMGIQPATNVCLYEYVSARYVQLSVTSFRTHVFIRGLKFVINYPYMRWMFWDMITFG